MTTPVADRFHIEGSRHPRPTSGSVIYADGSGSTRARPDVDTDLSHWVPNTTPAQYKADTSTEICLRYVSSPEHVDVDLVVNDHADIDGILSLYSLLEPDVALAHYDTLVGAASMGDFYAWADRPAFRLAQELSAMLFDDRTRPTDIGDCYALGFEITTSVLDGSRPESAGVAAGWAVLESGLERLGRDEIRVETVTDRLVAFIHPPTEAGALDGALRIPFVNEIVNDSVSLWPQVRNRDHSEQVHLVSVAGRSAWFHDVWAPSYCWAETPNRATFPGLVSTGDSNRWRLEDAALHRAVDELRDIESAPGVWVVADQLTPFETLPGRSFPVVVSFVNGDGDPAPSNLSPDRVATTLAPVW